MRGARLWFSLSNRSSISASANVASQPASRVNVGRENEKGKVSNVEVGVYRKPLSTSRTRVPLRHPKSVPMRANRARIPRRAVVLTSGCCQQCRGARARNLFCVMTSRWGALWTANLLQVALQVDDLAVLVCDRVVRQVYGISADSAGKLIFAGEADFAHISLISLLKETLSLSVR
jgi:hypothetical protein